MEMHFYMVSQIFSLINFNKHKMQPHMYFQELANMIILHQLLFSSTGYQNFRQRIQNYSAPLVTKIFAKEFKIFTSNMEITAWTCTTTIYMYEPASHFICSFPDSQIIW